MAQQIFLDRTLIEFIDVKVAFIAGCAERESRFYRLNEVFAP